MFAHVVTLDQMTKSLFGFDSGRLPGLLPAFVCPRPCDGLLAIPALEGAHAHRQSPDCCGGAVIGTRAGTSLGRDSSL